MSINEAIGGLSLLYLSLQAPLSFPCFVFNESAEFGSQISQDTIVIDVGWGNTDCSNHEAEEWTIFVDFQEPQLVTEDIMDFARSGQRNFLVCLGSSVSRQMNKDCI